MNALLESTVSFGPSLNDRLHGVETAAYMTPVAVPTRPNKPLPLFSFVLPSGEVKELRAALNLRVTEEDGMIFVENETLNLFGHGRTLHEAIEAFSRDLAYFWEYYRDLGPDEVAGEAVTLKRQYERLLT